MPATAAVTHFISHPLAGAELQTTGPFAGETKADAWLFSHSKFLRAHFDHCENTTDYDQLAETSAAQLEQGRGSVDTDDVATTPREDEQTEAKTDQPRRRSTLESLKRGGAKWAFWHNGNE